MSTWDSQAVDHYYSGQGVVLMGARDADGNPMGLYPVGNVSALKVTIATTTLEHKESHTGQRGTDLRITTEVKVGASVTMENYIAKNLAQALRGLYTLVPAATVAAQSFLGKAYPGSVIATGKIKMTAASLTQGATPLVAYVDELTAWDYKVNLEAGSFFLNDGSEQAFSALVGTVAASAVTVGATTSITVTVPAAAAVGDKVFLSGFTGGDAADLNGKVAKIVTKTGTTAITVDINTATKTITLGAGKVFFFTEGLTLTWGATYAEQYLIDSLAAAASDIFVRFEGLNTAEGNNPVVIEIFRLSTDPLKDLDLISDGIQQFLLEGSVLADNNRQTGSKYFSVQKVN